MKTSPVFRPTAISAALLLAASPVFADTATFNKSHYSTPKEPKEADVILSVGDDSIGVKGRKTAAPDIQIPYASITKITYELASRHRVAEGAAIMAVSLGAGAILMATKTRSHWLVIDYKDAAGAENTVLRLDKSEVPAVLAGIEAKSRHPVERITAKDSTSNPTANSHNVAQTVSFNPDQVTAALRKSMDDLGCSVTRTDGREIECKRKRGASERTGAGGEKIVAKLEPEGSGTHVSIETDKGFVGRGAKKNWSTAVFDGMMKTLQADAKTPPEGASKL